MTIKTIFLDRDGVINHEVNYLHKIEDFKFIDGVFESCRYFQKLGFKIIIISNQSGIGRGYYSLEEYYNLTEWLKNEFIKNKIEIYDIFFCPHHPEKNCFCRKPKPGMFLNAKNKHEIDMKNSWMIGDKESDISAARSSGVTNTILLKSGHKIDENNTSAKYILESIKDAIGVIQNM
ncbi:D-glycero-beta-D-manno-heptose 1,7-bisphosphate 7-phosphatase [Pseudothioglobus sp. nBUS_23]|uniref:D-glycero-beta-D-manno-heptose 1,7-bisphosphate 7-phosphatase n=1 Tax=Pseudothioglobus sp. nBUS_23 TaxID=3395318 RepID=UPI003EBCC80A